ncbi:MAG: flagellar hook-length control protein FliK [Halomonadaceae bacterium T82-2]|nr:MAG: flagellar hook-length control protein FliK [Halomonadaceae bacterium T82-2]
MALSALTPVAGTPSSSPAGNGASDASASPAGLFASLLGKAGSANAPGQQRIAGSPGVNTAELSAALKQLAAQLKGDDSGPGSLKEALNTLLKHLDDGSSAGQVQDTSLDTLLKRLSADQGDKPADGESLVDQLAALLQPLLAETADRKATLDLSALHQRLPRETAGGDATLDAIRQRLDAIAGTQGRSPDQADASLLQTARNSADMRNPAMNAMPADTLMAGRNPDGKVDGNTSPSLFQALQTAASATDGNAATPRTTAGLPSSSTTGDANSHWQGALLDAARGDTTQAPLNTFASQASGALGGTAGHAAGAAAAPATATLSAPVASAQWQQGLGQQLVQLHQRGGQQVQLHLHPAELGPLSVQLKIDDQLAQAQFLSHNPQVRAAVEQAIPQLRAALNEAGIQLGEAMVGDQPQPGQQDASGGSGHPASGAPGTLAQGTTRLDDEGVDGETRMTITAPLNSRAGGVDLYA